MLVCPQCGEENPERARFCVRCGSPLPAVGVMRREERKIVSVLFCELLGVEEAADPEDRKRLLGPYQAKLRQQLANHGGTVDKFMGSTMLAVFGAPVAHEDDPERAVRTALRIVDEVHDLLERVRGGPSAVRIAVNTGEAIVARPGSGPQIGEAVTGDVVNTASRLLSIAAADEVVVGEETHDATAYAIRYEARDPVRVKGKAEPVTVWRAVEAISRMGVDMRPKPQTPFVGRRDERAILEGAFRRTLTEPSVQMVTVTGEPGVGKTRLVQELASVVDEYPDLIRWRQGRCLPYGEGISFWALGEIVKGEAGILESDGPQEVSVKLGRALAPLVEDAAERDWLKGRLAPLVGVDGAALDVPRDELFTAWRRFVEVLAAKAPTVLVFEDLQWADDALLDFVGYLVDWTVGLPLLVACTARPELYGRHPDWGGGRRNAASIALPPLTQAETAMLLSALLDRAVLPADTQAALLERSGGNPLYAEEFVRMLRDRNLLETDRAGVALPDAAAIPVPQTVQLLIGARLDTLPPEDKSVLQDAAVAGKVFWTGLVSATTSIADDRVEAILHELVRREFVRPARTSSIRGEAEFSFWHGLVQDVAYGQIPRAARGAKHLAVASWITDVAGDRMSDMAELLAHHYGEALDLARIAGEPTDELERLTGVALVMAGDRAKRLDATRAEELYRRARSVLPADDRERTRALMEAASAADSLGRFDDSERDLSVAMHEYREAGDQLGLGEAMVRLARSPAKHGEEAQGLLERAIQILQRDRAGPELARAYTRMAGHLYVAGRDADSIAWAEKALVLADELGLEDERVLALQYRGAARSQRGDRGGLDDLRRALRLGLELGLGDETAIAYNNLALQLWGWEGPAAAQAVYAEMIDFCLVRGFATMQMWAEAGSLESRFDLGEWDAVLDVADRMREWDRAHGETALGITALTFRAWVLLRRGEDEALGPVVDELLPRARRMEYAEYLAPALILAAERELARGRDEDAVALVREFAQITESQPEYRRVFIPLAARLLVRAKRVDEAEAMLADAGPGVSRRQRLGVDTTKAIVLEARGRHAEALELFDRMVIEWDEFGFDLERVRSLLGAARCLVALGRPADAVERTLAARPILLELGTRPLLEEAEALLASATASSA